MGEYSVQDLYDKFFSLFEPYEVQDNNQVIKYNCYEDQLILDTRTNTRVLIKGDRWKTFTGDRYIMIDDDLNNTFNKLLHLIKINDKVRSEGYEGITTLKKEYSNYMRILFGKKKFVRSNTPKYLFFSCVPKNRINISEGEVSKMRNFLKKYVTSKYFQKYAYCIESGKHIDKPNLHFHILCLYNENGSKNFRNRVLREYWNKLYPDNPLDWKQGERVGIDRYECNTDYIISDKLKYFHNDSKGSHENFIDLKIYEEFGDWSKYREG